MYCILTGLDRIKPENEVFEISASSNKTFGITLRLFFELPQFDRRNLHNYWEDRVFF